MKRSQKKKNQSPPQARAAAAAVSLEEFLGRDIAEALGREAERYLRAVDTFSAEGCPPHWR